MDTVTSKKSQSTSQSTSNTSTEITGNRFTNSFVSMIDDFDAVKEKAEKENASEEVSSWIKGYNMDEVALGLTRRANYKMKDKIDLEIIIKCYKRWKPMLWWEVPEKEQRENEERIKKIYEDGKRGNMRTEIIDGMKLLREEFKAWYNERVDKKLEIKNWSQLILANKTDIKFIFDKFVNIDNRPDERAPLAYSRVWYMVLTVPEVYAFIEREMASFKEKKIGSVIIQPHFLFPFLRRRDINTADGMELVFDFWQIFFKDYKFDPKGFDEETYWKTCKDVVIKLREIKASDSKRRVGVLKNTDIFSLMVDPELALKMKERKAQRSGNNKK